jgi:hypothetical protein
MVSKTLFELPAHPIHQVGGAEIARVLPHSLVGGVVIKPQCDAYLCAHHSRIAKRVGVVLCGNAKGKPHLINSDQGFGEFHARGRV